MSRPIFSRPRTRVYGCNYDKGESYYKPMVDHLDRKYSSRPLFSEPRTSLADEIAARRSDIGSRGLAGSRLDDLLDDLEGEGERIAGTEEESIEDFIRSHRRMKERESEAFERDLAELRRKRRDMQEKMFDMIDMDAEIERAKLTLEGANVAFSKHAMKFDNSEETPRESTNSIDKKDRKQSGQGAKKKSSVFRWTKMEEIEKDPPGLVQGIYNRRARVNSIMADDLIGESGPVQEVPQAIPRSKAPREKTKKKRSVVKRKKSVSF